MPDAHIRAELWQRAIEAIEDYTARVDSLLVTPELNPEKIRDLVKAFDFSNPVAPLEALIWARRKVRENESR